MHGHTLIVLQVSRRQLLLVHAHFYWYYHFSTIIRRIEIAHQRLVVKHCFVDAFGLALQRWICDFKQLSCEVLSAITGHARTKTAPSDNVAISVRSPASCSVLISFLPSPAPAARRFRASGSRNGWGLVLFRLPNLAKRKP